MRHHAGPPGLHTLSWIVFPGLTAGATTWRPSGPLIVGNAVLAWSKDYPDAKVTAALPIVSGGNTVLVHLWYVKEKKREKP